MPTYEYSCEKCGRSFELFQSMKDEPLKKCPECGKDSLKRLIGTGAGIIFKGSGFYETDYRSENYKKAEKKETESLKSDVSGKKEPKTESKTKTVKETKTS